MTTTRIETLLSSVIRQGAIQLNTAAAGNIGVIDAVYDFAVLGGAIATINLQNASVPNKAVVIGGFVDTITVPTSGGAATISLGLNTTTDLKAATAFGSYTGIVALTPVFTAATAVKATAQRTVTATIAAATLTAGKFHVALFYVVTE